VITKGVWIRAEPPKPSLPDGPNLVDRVPPTGKPYEIVIDNAFAAVFFVDG